MTRLSYTVLASVVTLVVMGSALAAPASRIAARGVTQSQQDVVDQLNAYRAQLDAANAQWQSDSMAALQSGEAPPPFPDVPVPEISAPGYDDEEPSSGDDEPSSDDGDDGTTETDDGTTEDSGFFGSDSADEDPAVTAADQSQADTAGSSSLLSMFG